jgi:hypothetical protein
MLRVRQHVGWHHALWYLFFFFFFCIMVSPRPTWCWARGGTLTMAIKEGKKLLQQTLMVQSRRMCSCTRFCHRATRISAAKQGITKWVLQQDSDTTHKRAAAMAVLLCNGKHSSTLSHLTIRPPNSPSLNPIGNLWAIVKRRVDARGPKSWPISINRCTKSVMGCPSSSAASS